MASQQRIFEHKDELDRMLSLLKEIKKDFLFECNAMESQIPYPENLGPWGELYQSLREMRVHARILANEMADRTGRHKPKTKRSK